MRARSSVRALQAVFGQSVHQVPEHTRSFVRELQVVFERSVHQVPEHTRSSIRELFYVTVVQRYRKLSYALTNQKRLDTLMDMHGTPYHVWLVNITRSTRRSTILGSRIVEMGPYCSYASVVLGSHNFAARVS